MILNAYLNLNLNLFNKGFFNKAFELFANLDLENKNKIDIDFSSKGQGRLDLRYFSDCATYESIFHNENQEVYKRTFNYPSSKEMDFFSFESDNNKLEKVIEKKDSCTILIIDIYSTRSKKLYIK